MKESKREKSVNTEYVSAYDLVIEGDKQKSEGFYNKAILNYLKAYSKGSPEQIKYIVPRVASCYRIISQPKMALNFYRGARSMYGDIVNDHVMLTVLSSIHGDLKNWEQALYCADYACELNDGVINAYLENVYRRIDANIGNKEFA